MATRHDIPPIPSTYHGVYPLMRGSKARIPVNVDNICSI
jgi:hypothetical protein